MRRGDRLFELIGLLRRQRAPITADALARQLETSKRTVYRDIAALMSQRVPIRGEAGTGYVLDQAYDLPPLAFTADEIEAVTLGSQWVAAHTDPALARAAQRVLAKVAAVIPTDLRHLIDDPAVGTPPAHWGREDSGVDLGKLRAWSQRGNKLVISYTDAEGRESKRTVWPFFIGYHHSLQVVVAWCELREDVRIFRVERLRSVVFLDEAYPENPVSLRRRWLAEVEHKMAPRAVDHPKTRSP